MRISQLRALMDEVEAQSKACGFGADPIICFYPSQKIRDFTDCTPSPRDKQMPISAYQMREAEPGEGFIDAFTFHLEPFEK